MGLKHSKSPSHILIETKLALLTKIVHDVQYDLHHTSDVNFRHSIKNRNVFKITQDLLVIQELIEKDDVIESLSSSKRKMIQIRIDELALKIQEITKYK